MDYFDNLFASIVAFNDTTKRHLLNLIGAEYDDNELSFNNEDTIYNWLTKNNYRGEPTLEGINEYIEEFFHPKYETEDYFEERIPEYQK